MKYPKGDAGKPEMLTAVHAAQLENSNPADALLLILPLLLMVIQPLDAPVVDKEKKRGEEDALMLMEPMGELE